MDLYNKKTKSLSYFLGLCNYRLTLFDIIKHYFLKIVINDNYTLLNPCQNEELLFPEFHNRLKDILLTYSYHISDDKPCFFETFRSLSRQHHLFNQGVTKIRTYSMHHFGLAADIVNSKNKSYQWNLDYDILRRLAIQKELTVLNWELCHFQFIPVSMQGVIIHVINESTKIIQDLINVQIDGIIGVKTISNLKINIDKLETYFNQQLLIIKKLQ